MDRPTSDFVRSILPKVPWQKMGFADVPDGTADPLDFHAGLAADYVEFVTGRPQDASMPDSYARMAQMADALRVVQQITDTTGDQVDAYASSDVLASMSTDGYSETYRDTGISGKAQNEARMVNPWPPLNRLLWLLMTPQRWSWWIAFLEGGGIPAWGVTEVDWSGWNRWAANWDTSAGQGGLPGDMPVGGGVSDIPPNTGIV